ncbi:hypothetical protein S40285_07451 [Stachybotrys chlorohalonatus IBT 40285]|uniref:Uncharacterized protein n=1 Tax=Stachybotrys chlorohalonatus (strain IBT 40285) TaxID=1283841 RepID=A0A084R126_STAC4|nr:hypothetical protein S40285_07451 [Stachybotrys chlorohalonata IBT 40285]
MRHPAVTYDFDAFLDLSYLEQHSPNAASDFAREMTTVRWSSSEGLNRGQYNGPAPRTELKCDKNGNVQGVLNVFGLDTKVRSRFTNVARASVALARKRGACEKCHRLKVGYKMPDNPYEPCARYSIISPGFLQRPCTRVNIIDIVLHRLGSTKDNALNEWLAKKDMRYLDNGESLANVGRKIFLTQDFGCELQDTVAEFHVSPRDKMSYPWREASGKPRVLDMPPYYMSPLLKDTLRFWSACRLTERPWRICGTDMLGMSPVPDIDCPWGGTVPVTPIMDTQMDHLVIHTIMNPLRKKIITQLYAKIMQKHRENWYEIYLTMFILMGNMERQFAQVLFFFSMYGMDGRFGRRGNSSVSESFIHGCKTMLVYFHYACGGHAPLDTDWSSPKSPYGIMSKEQIEYLQMAKREVDRQGSEMATLKGKSMYKTEMYWAHQLLMGGHDVDQQNDREIDELHEDNYILHWSEE